MIFRTTDVDYLFQIQTQEKIKQWVGPLGGLLLRGQERNSSTKALPVILLFINTLDNLPSLPHNIYLGLDIRRGSF